MMLRILSLLLQWLMSILIMIRTLFQQTDVLPILHCRESALTKHLIRRRGFLRKPYRPSLLLRNGFVQTFVAYFHIPTEDFEFQREYLQMTNRGVVSLDWYTKYPDKLKINCPIVVIFPRLTGDAASVGKLCKMATSRGFRAVVFNRRGHGSSLLTTSKLTSTGDTSDTKQMLEYIMFKYPCVQVVGIGIGAGCATLFSYLGEFGSSSLLKAVVCVSPSYDNTEKLCDKIPKWYELLLLLKMKLLLIRYCKAFYKIIDIKAAVFNAWTLKEFDYHVYCKLYGIDTFETFWTHNDPMRDIDDISAPVLCINSLDDQVSRRENIPLELFEYYPNLLLVTVEKGGHCAFHEDILGNSWADNLALQFLEGVLEFITHSRAY